MDLLEAWFSGILFEKREVHAALKYGGTLQQAHQTALHQIVTENTGFWLHLCSLRFHMPMIPASCF